MDTIHFEKSKDLFKEIKSKNLDMSLDEILESVYNALGTKESFEEARPFILSANGINEYEFYTKRVDKSLKDYVENSVFPEYDKNDKAHGIIHIKEVIRRAFALNDTLKLGLDPNKIFAVTAFHDLGKYIDHEIHEKIAAQKFMSDPKMSEFFGEEDRKEIMEAIEDHRSSFEDVPRSMYGKLASSADRNTRIEIVFIRSFFVGQSRTPDMNVEDFLDFTFKRLSKRYGEENPENMFLEDNTYKTFLQDMRNLLQNETEFKKRYCLVNHISSRESKLLDEKGELDYLK